MIKWIGLFSLCLSLIATSAIASVGIQDDGSNVGAASVLNIVGETTATYDGSTKTIDISKPASVTTTTVDASGDCTFQTSLIGLGRISDSSSLDSSSTRIGSTTVPYCLVRKIIGHAAEATTLNNGITGQVLVIVCTHGYGGTWTITPSTSQPISTITMTTTKDAVTLLYVNDTMGWIAIDSEGATTVNWRE